MGFLNKIAFFISRFMYGRNGVDTLNLAILALSLALSVAGAVFGLYPLAFLSYLALALVIYRTISRDLNRRRRENMRFLALFSRIKTRFALTKRRFKERSTHKIVRCSQCGQMLRVKRVKAKKVRVTCVKCGQQTIVRL